MATRERAYLIVNFPVIPSEARDLLLLALAPRAAQIGEAADDTDTALKPLTKER